MNGDSLESKRNRDGSHDHDDIEQLDSEEGNEDQQRNELTTATKLQLAIALLIVIISITAVAIILATVPEGKT